MRGFQRRADGSVCAGLDADEATLLQALAGQVAELVASASGTAAADPALQRLLPDAYPQDQEASHEFRRFTADRLSRMKLQNALTLIDSLNGTATTGEVALDDAGALAWLQSLTDIRLTIATRLGIADEDDEAGRAVDPMMRDIYDWLGFVQNSLVEALDGEHG